MTHILIGTPCYNGLVTAEYLVSMLGLQRELIRQGIEFEVDTPTTVSLIPVARNYLASEVLRHRRFTHLLFIDADLGFEPSQVSRLLSADKDVVAGIYPLKHLNVPAIRDLPSGKPVASTYHYAVAIAPGTQPTSDGFAQAEYAATGFMLIRREVLERMAAHYADLKYTHMFALPGAPERPRTIISIRCSTPRLILNRGSTCPRTTPFAGVGAQWGARSGSTFSVNSDISDRSLTRVIFPCS